MTTKKRVDPPGESAELHGHQEQEEAQNWAAFFLLPIFRRYTFLEEA